MPPTYYIDGYNVIHHSSWLKPLAAQDFESARDALVEKVARFCVATGGQAKIVFDGRGRQTQPLAPLTGIPGLEVIYSPGHRSADTLIERIVYTAQDRRSIIVVSADRGIRTVCRGLSAMVMEPDNFLATVREAEADTRASLEQVQRPDALLRIEGRLDQDTLERLAKLRQTLGK